MGSGTIITPLDRAIVPVSRGKFLVGETSPFERRPQAETIDGRTDRIH